MKLLEDEKALWNFVNGISEKYFHKSFQHKVEFNSRLRTTGGRYIPAQKKIELNPKYIIEMDESEFIGIIKHELCHYHLHIEGKGYKHGDEEFKALLKSTRSPRHCRPLPSSKNKYKHKYICTKCKHVYKRVRRIDVNKYRCGKCKSKLVIMES